MTTVTQAPKKVTVRFTETGETSRMRAEVTGTPKGAHLTDAPPSLEAYVLDPRSNATESQLATEFHRLAYDLFKDAGNSKVIGGALSKPRDPSELPPAERRAQEAWTAAGGRGYVRNFWDEPYVQTRIDFTSALHETRERVRLPGSTPGEVIARGKLAWQRKRHKPDFGAFREITPAEWTATMKALEARPISDEERAQMRAAVAGFIDWVASAS